RTGRIRLHARNRYINGAICLCQGGRAQDFVRFGRRDFNARCDDDKARFRMVWERLNLCAAPRAERRAAGEKEGHIRAEARAEFDQLLLIYIDLPEMRE